jgi:SAM-dependent methyltransferase
MDVGDPSSVLRIPAWWPALLKQSFGMDTGDSALLKRAADAVQRLSAHLNDVQTRRNQRTLPYLSDPQLRAAYTLYYMTANMLKLHAPLREIALAGVFRNRSDLSVIDLGCGPGTGLAGLASWLPPECNLSYTGLDVLPQALDYTATLGVALKNVLPGLRVATMRADISRLRSHHASYDLVLMMNALNEIPGNARSVNAVLQQVTDANGWVILIEPALRSTSRTLLELRDTLVHEGWTVYAPCLRQRHCPALEAPQDWCHHDAAWERPEYIRTIDHVLGMVKLSLKFSYLVLNRHGATLAGQLDTENPCRIVSELAKEKGRSWCFVCGEQGRVRLRRNTRDASASNIAMDTLSRYDIISMVNSEARGDGQQVLPETVITKVRRASTEG